VSLVSRCPRCRTLYRVTPAQLQARAGQVRCGRCMNVFDGFAALAAEQANASPDPVQFAPDAASGAASAPADAQTTKPPAEPASATPNPPDAVRNPGASSPAARAAAFQAPRSRPAAAAQSSPLAPPAPEPAATIPARKPASERFRDFADGRIVTPLRDNMLRKPSARTSRVAASALLGLLLVVQVAYSFRSQLAARYPAVRSVMSSVCGVAGCTVSLPQRPDLVKIEASDVHMIDANRPALIQLTATLRSYASYDLAYPALDLVLTNANEHALARRIFVPEEYLDQTRNPKGGIPPRAEITVALDLDTGDLNAAGFRLDLIAAPSP
jgi:predicted Zn finger-like uncharacterized protein